MTVNEELFRTVVKQIETFPQFWDQEEWAVKSRCGTFACVAGWTLIVSGRMDGAMRVLDKDGNPAPCFFDDGHSIGCQCSVPQVAMQLLGLDAKQADEIFFWGPVDDGHEVDRLKEHLTKVTGVVFD